MKRLPTRIRTQRTKLLVLFLVMALGVPQPAQGQFFPIDLAAIVSAIVTPPDVISQLALLGPMIVLYEVGIIAARVFIKHTKAPEEDAEKAT